MTSERTTWNITTEAAESLESVAERRADESANDFILRVASMLDGTDAGTDVTSYDIPEDVLTESHIDDLVSRTARQTADELESRLR